MYSEKVLDHFHHPRNVGEIPNATVVVEMTNPVCGDLMKLWAIVEKGRILDVKFKTQGCVPAVACGSWLTAAIKGKPLAEISGITAEQIERGLDGLPSASRHASVLAADALKQLVEKARVSG
ncbi:MAG: iron-sulfur cluster assembly scaffold protein [Acidobacteria bacterium]|nr:iron-sulfur cluster assembly scaffold protein [Acidobacteriota bacterium]